VFAILAGFHGVGVPDSKLSKVNTAMAAYDLGYWIIVYAVSLNLVKASIALAMMRISTDRRYTIGLWIFMLAEMVIVMTCLITFLVICVPPGAQFDRSLGSCKTYTLGPSMTWPFSIIGILSDWACAVAPVLIIRKLNMPHRQKRSIMIVLALGAFASVGAIVRMPYLKYFIHPENSLCEYSKH
jgi:heme/copper-type cytochrome/quinol oxidase subunit 3